MGIWPSFHLSFTFLIRADLLAAVVVPADEVVPVVAVVVLVDFFVQLEMAVTAASSYFLHFPKALVQFLSSLAMALASVENLQFLVA